MLLLPLTNVKTKIMIAGNEKFLEKKLREEIKKIGGLAIKFTSPYFTGMPDRLVLMPNGNLWFVEVKSTGKKLRGIQQAQALRLQELGFKTRVIDSDESLGSFMREDRHEL